MHEGIIIAGFGGQGILFTGRLLSQAGLYSGMDVTYLPSYGAEVRGGTAHCHVILSDVYIASPVVANPTTIIVMNNPSLVKFEPRLKSGGLLLFNSSLVESQPVRSDVHVISIPATEMASELGNVRVANMIMLGRYLACRDILSKKSIVESLSIILSPDRGFLVDINLKAMELGYNYSTVEINP